LGEINVKAVCNANNNKKFTKFLWLPSHLAPNTMTGSGIVYSFVGYYYYMSLMALLSSGKYSEHRRIKFYLACPSIKTLKFNYFIVRAAVAQWIVHCAAVPKAAAGSVLGSVEN